MHARRFGAGLCAALLVAVLGTGCGDDEGAGAVAESASAPAAEIEARAAFFAKLREAGRARRRGAVEEEVVLLQRALADKPDHEGALVDLAHALRKLGRREETLGVLARLRRLRPDLPRPHYLLAELLSEEPAAPEADLRRALALYERALAIEPNISGPRLGAARTQRRLGLLPDAARSYRTVLGTNPDSLEALEGLGMLLIEDQKNAAAVAFLVRALEVGTRAQGRADVPSEMDTLQSFDAESMETERNRALRAALGRAARALGAYPAGVPARFRLPLTVR